MPKLYEYLGIIIMFYANDHEPIHVHGTHGGKECKAEILMRDGEVYDIKFIPVGQGLEAGKQREFEKFVGIYAEDIVEKWVDFFVYKKKISPKIITKKL
jgi:hypothetical protein